MATKPQYQQLSDFYVFPMFATQADFEKATGLTCPPWNPNKRPKRWADPKPVDSGMEVDGVSQALYRVLDPGTMETGGIRTKLILVSLADAVAVNLPPLLANVPGADQPEVPVPLKDLSPTQQFVRRTPFSGVQVQNMDVVDPGAPVDVGDVQAILDMLARMEAKLDKVVAAAAAAAAPLAKY